MDLYSIVHHGVIAHFEAMASLSDATMTSTTGGPGTVGTTMRAQGQQLAPIYASLAVSAADRARANGPALPSPFGPIPVPIPGLPTSGWPSFPGAPGLPNLPIPGLPGLPNLPGLPLPNLPGLDPCAFLKCLASSMACSCGAGPVQPDLGRGAGTSTDPARQLMDQALGLFDRARQYTDVAAKEAEQKVADLKAAAANASEARRKAILTAQKLAEEMLREAQRQGEEISTAVGTVIAGFPG